MHKESHPLAGKTATVQMKAGHPQLEGGGTEPQECRVEDWWDTMTGGSWMHANGNPAALVYGMRRAGGLPLDNEVVYVKIGAFGHLVHDSELTPV